MLVQGAETSEPSDAVPAPSPAQDFLQRADRVAERLQRLLGEIDENYAKLRSKILSAAMDANDTDLYDPNLSSLVASARKETTPKKETDADGGPSEITATPGQSANPGASQSGGETTTKGAAADRAALLANIAEMTRKGSQQGMGLDEE